MTPGQAELARSELALADQALRAAQMLLEEGAREDAASRLYYAAFHAPRGALTVRGVSAKTHSGQAALFEQTYGGSGVLGRLFDLRARADYGTPGRSFDVSTAELEAEIGVVGEFIERCRAIVSEELASGPDEPDPPADV